MESKSGCPRHLILVAWFICFLTPGAFGLTESGLEAEIRAATTGCPDFTIAPPAAGGAVLDASTFGVSPNNTGAQNYQDFTNAIAHCQGERAYKLTVPTGIYHVGSSNSSYGNGIFYFNHLTNFIFDGQGSTFMMQSKSDFVVVRYCSRAAFQNYTMNWDWSVTPVQSLTEVVSLATNGTYMDLYYPYESNPAANSLLYELDEVAEQVEATNGAYATNFEFSHQGAGVIGVGDLATNETTSQGNSTLQYYTSKGSGWFYNHGVRPGQYYLLRHYSYEYPGDDVEYNNNLTFSNVTVYSTLGMGFSLIDNQYWQIIDSRLIREPGSVYHLSSASDGINNSIGHGCFKLENDELGNCGDDNINIHDGTSEGIKTIGAHTFTAEKTVDYKDPYNVGDVVELRQGNYAPWNWSSSVTASTNNGSSYSLAFSNNLPAGLTTNSILFNHTYDSGNYIISGCQIHDSKGKGAFLHTANGTVENNQFIRNYNPGLFIASINSYYGLGSSYGEGYDPGNIIVQNNTFVGNNIIRNNGVTDTYFPNDIVIVGQTGPEPVATYPICHDIIFQNNLVENSTHASLEIASATNVLVQNNTFENPCLTNDMTLLGCVIITNAGEVVFNNNALVIDPGVKSYQTNVYVAPSLTNIFVDSFTNLLMDEGPPLISDGPDDLFSYSGLTNVLSIIVSGSSPFSYQWYADGAPVMGATNDSYPFAVLPGTNTYYCAVTNSCNVGAPTLSRTATVAGVIAPEILNAADFSYRMKIQFTGYGNRDETLEDFPALVRLGTNVSGFSYQQFASPGGADLRFADSSGTVSLPYEMDQWDDTNGNSTIWVQVPSLAGTNDFIWAYWGNPADVAPPDYTTNGAVWRPAAFQSLPAYDLVYHLGQNGFPYLDSTLQYPAANGIAPASAAGLIGPAASFNKSAYLDAGPVNLGNAFTLSAWVKVSSSASSILTIWANGIGVADSPQIFFYVNDYETADGALILTTGNGGSTEDQLKSPAGAVGSNAWHLVTAAVDRADSVANLYVDGNQVAAGGAMNSFPTNNDLDLGQDTQGTFKYAGLMDEARIRSCLSSSNWVWASYMTVAANPSFESYSGVCSPAARIGIQIAGGNVILTWPGGTLQSADDLAGPYGDVPAATSPYTNAVSGTRQFYRVKVR